MGSRRLWCTACTTQLVETCKKALDSGGVGGAVLIDQKIAKVNGSLDALPKIVRGVSQDLVLEPLLSNIYLNDLLVCLEETKVSNYAGDNHLCV